MTIEEQKRDLLIDISWDLAFSRMTMIPQFLLLMLTAVIFTGMAVWGLYVAITNFQDTANPDFLRKAVPIFLGGSSTLLGLPLSRVLPMLAERGVKFVSSERDYTAFIARIKNVTTHADLIAVIADYRKIKN
jgi:hypothetical protein